MFEGLLAAAFERGAGGPTRPSPRARSGRPGGFLAPARGDVSWCRGLRGADRSSTTSRCRWRWCPQVVAARADAAVKRATCQPSARSPFGHLGDGNLHFNLLPACSTMAKAEFLRPLGQGGQRHPAMTRCSAPWRLDLGRARRGHAQARRTGQAQVAGGDADDARDQAGARPRGAHEPGPGALAAPRSSGRHATAQKLSPARGHARWRPPRHAARPRTPAPRPCGRRRRTAPESTRAASRARP